MTFQVPCTQVHNFASQTNKLASKKATIQNALQEKVATVGVGPAAEWTRGHLFLAVAANVMTAGAWVNWRRDQFIADGAFEECGKFLQRTQGNQLVSRHLGSSSDDFE